MIDINHLRVNLENKILRSNETIILPHTIADFDAIGSALGLSLVAREFHKDSKIIVDDKKYDLDKQVKFIIDENRARYDIINSARYRKIVSPDNLYVLTDNNKIDRITISDLITDPENTIIIDHHEPDKKNTVKSKYKYIDIDVSSASEVVAKVLLDMGVTIPTNIANYLLAGIYLDTDSLTKGEISDETFKTASDLVKAGAKTSDVVAMLQEDEESLQRIENLSKKTIMITYKIALSIAEEKEEYTKKELAKIANRGITKGANVSFAMGRLANNVIGISARSNRTIHVGKIMKNFKKGGGSRVSAAATVEGESFDEVANKLDKYIRPKYYVKERKEVKKEEK